ncbi:MAG TPA: cobalamin-binding protein [Firmicutes bacterium]|nr:cobalamin-binding protein [Bacillota bacterium]
MSKNVSKVTKAVAFFLLLGVLLVTAACATENDARMAGEKVQPFSVTLIDDLDREIRLDRLPERIVSLAPSNTEMLFALGLDGRIVGVSEHCDYPAAALVKPKVGTFAEPNLELVVAAEPDLVVAVHLQEEKLTRLDELGIPVLVLSPSSVAEIYASLELLGEAAQVQENARIHVAQMQERIQKITEKAASLPAKKRVYYEVYADPLMSVGSDTVIHELIETAGGYNIFSDVETPYPKISAETVIDRNPQVIIFPNYHGDEAFMANEIINRPGWQSVDAVQNERVVGIDPNIISRPGPRIVEAVEQLAAMIYPELN